MVTDVQFLKKLGVMKNRALLDQAGKELDNPPRRYNTRGSSKHNRDDSPKRNRRDMLDRDFEGFLKLIKDSDVNALRSFIAKFNKSSICKAILESTPNIFYKQISWDTACESAMVADIAMLNLLIDQFDNRLVKLKFPINKDDLGLTMQRKGDLIKVSGVRLKFGDEFITSNWDIRTALLSQTVMLYGIEIPNKDEIYRLTVHTRDYTYGNGCVLDGPMTYQQAVASHVSEDIAKEMGVSLSYAPQDPKPLVFFQISYDINAEGRMINYLSKERVDKLQSIGLLK
jgi:hypothetical protein